MIVDGGGMPRLQVLSEGQWAGLEVLLPSSVEVRGGRSGIIGR